MLPILFIIIAWVVSMPLWASITITALAGLELIVYIIKICMALNIPSD